MTPRIAADIKELASRLAEQGPPLLFLSGEGDGFQLTEVEVEVDGGLALLLVSCPPAGASDELLLLLADSRGRISLRGKGALRVRGVTGDVSHFAHELLRVKFRLQ
jgi:hypothetical protein